MLEEKDYKKIGIQKAINELYDLRDAYNDLYRERDDEYLRGVCSGISKSIEKLEELKKS